MVLSVGSVISQLKHGRRVRCGHPTAAVTIRVCVTPWVWHIKFKPGGTPPRDSAETVTAETAVSNVVTIAMHPGERPGDVAATVAALAVVVGDMVPVSHRPVPPSLFFDD